MPTMRERIADLLLGDQKRQLQNKALQAMADADARAAAAPWDGAPDYPEMVLIEVQLAVATALQAVALALLARREKVPPESDRKD